MIEISEEFLATVLGTDVEQLTLATKEGEELKPQTEVEAYFTKQFDERVYQAKREARDEGYGRGKKESLSAKELEIRKKFDLKGSTIDEMITELKEVAKQKPNLTPEDVRNTEIYKLEIDKRDIRIKELGDESDKVIRSYRAKEVRSKVKSRVMSLMSEKGYVAKDGIKDGDIVLDAVIRSLSNEKTVLAIDDSGNIVVRDETGQAKLDDHTVQPVSFDDLAVSRLDQVYVIPASDGRKMPGNKNGKVPATPNDDGFVMPENDTEYMATLSKLPIDKKSKYIEFHDAQLQK